MVCVHKSFWHGTTDSLFTHKLRSLKLFRVGFCDPTPITNVMHNMAYSYTPLTILYLYFTHTYYPGYDATAGSLAGL